MTRYKAPNRLPLAPVSAWPASLRAEWQRVTSPAPKLFARTNPAREWAPATFRQAEQGLGKLVSYIGASGSIDDTVGIVGLVTEPALQGFVAGIIAEGLAPGTQASYLNGI
jgi:hypothetical protein